MGIVQKIIEQNREIERLKAVNERDRSTVASGISSIREAIRRREWLRLGRGSYEYDDDRWRGEFSHAIDEIMEALGPFKSAPGAKAMRVLDRGIGEQVHFERWSNSSARVGATP